MKILQEITVWDVDYEMINHTYLVNNKGKVIASDNGRGQVLVYKSRHVLDKRYRKFVEVKHAKLARIAKEVGEEVEQEIIVGQKFTVESESGNVYTVVKNEGRYSCSCIGYGYHRKCRHIETVKKSEEV